MNQNDMEKLMDNEIEIIDSADVQYEIPNIYQDKEKGYYSFRRKNIIDLIVMGSHRVLDVGCGDGSVLREMKKQGKATEIVGVDIHHQQKPEGLDAFIAGDIEQLTLPYPQNYFDVIVCADVLEHLKDPWAALANLRSFLANDGSFIISLPNFRELKTLFGIALRGDFGYVERGVLDKTHLRFFCRRNIVDLVSGAGLKIVAIHAAIGGRRPLVNKVTFGLFEEFLAVQYVVVAGKK